MNRSLVGLAPGNILQNLFVRERIRILRSSRGYSTFIEFGAGMGYLSAILLSEGMTGVAVDLNETACESNRAFNKTSIDSDKYVVINGDFLSTELPRVDVILSCMVVEHLTDDVRLATFEKAKHLLKPGGSIITLVPAGMKFWNIEDEVAGHIRRYEPEDFEQIAKKTGMQMAYLAGLTYPISNLLFRLSNRLVKKHESEKLALSVQQRTVDTGQRDVPFKTTFPKAASVVLNPIVMYPFHIIQKMFRHSRFCMTLYCEMVAD